MLSAIATAALLMTLIVAMRYLASSGIFAWITARIRPGHYAGLQGQIRREIYWSLLSAAVYGVPAGVTAWAWSELGATRIYTDITEFSLWYLPLSLLIYLILHDSWFYWTHRWMHRPRLFRLAHAVHHESKPPTAWTAMSFHPLEALTGAIVIPTLVFLIPIHIAMLGAVLAIMTLMGVTNHMGWELFPRWLVHSKVGEWVITASHHERHHEQYLCNFGLYFRFWDRVCGTDRGLTEKFQ
ncbi:MAG: fatty acid hydroxylase family protein [Sphingomonadales bacterium]|nr:MAG: fatty acid hydroxylase family protein [Sphingomonadales bacterium]